MSLGGVEAGGAGGPSPVLRVVVENLFYPVTLDVLHQVDFVCLLEKYIFFYSSHIALGLNVVVSSTDFFQIWHCFESNYFHQEQPVSGSSAVC